MKWTKEKDDNLIELIKNGENHKKIAEHFGISYNSVRGRCQKLKIKISDYAKEIIKEQINCLECGKIISSSNFKFCSKSCTAIFNNKVRYGKKEIKKCINCGNDLLIGTKQFKYCSKDCKIEFEYNTYITKWKNGEVDGNKCKHKDSLSNHVRKYIFIKYDNKCTKCGWNEINQYTKKIPLEVDHIDGNHLNSVEENLNLLCPSCHSLTEFYGSRNKGRGREFRRK